MQKLVGMYGYPELCCFQCTGHWNNDMANHLPPAVTDQLREQLDGRGWRLRFPEPLESEYQEDYAKRYQSHVTLAMLLGLVALIACGIGDWMWMRDRYSMMWVIRLAVCIPMLILFMLARRPSSRPWLQWLILLDAQAGALGILIFAGMALPPIRYYYEGGILLVMLVVFVLSRQQFWYGLLSAAIMASMSNAFILVINHSDQLVLLSREFILCFGMIFVLTGNFLIDRSLRQHYLQMRLLDLDNRGLEATNLRLQYLTAIDGLTMIANRRALDSSLSTEWTRALRKKESISLLMIDVDNFKQYNDMYGHLAGDSCLRDIASTLRPFARRPGDLAARYGGEEFAVILTGTQESDALAVAESIRNEIVALSIPHSRSSHGAVTVSIGVASMIPHASHRQEDLYAQADQALYRAKRSGRNRVVATGEFRA